MRNLSFPSLGTWYLYALAFLGPIARLAGNLIGLVPEERPADTRLSGTTCEEAKAARALMRENFERTAGDLAAAQFELDNVIGRVATALAGIAILTGLVAASLGWNVAAGVALAAALLELAAMLTDRERLERTRDTHAREVAAQRPHLERQDRLVQELCGFTP